MNLDQLYSNTFQANPEVLDDLIKHFYTPTLKQATVEDTYFRLGAHDVMCYILAKIELNKLTVTNGSTYTDEK